MLESDFTITPGGWDLRLVGHRNGREERKIFLFLFNFFFPRSKDCFASFDLRERFNCRSGVLFRFPSMISAQKRYPVSENGQSQHFLTHHADDYRKDPPGEISPIGSGLLFMPCVHDNLPYAVFPSGRSGRSSHGFEKPGSLQLKLSTAAKVCRCPGNRQVERVGNLP